MTSTWSFGRTIDETLAAPVQLVGTTIDLIDSGRGIDDATIQRIFEPFFSTKRGGTGLGLPTVRKIVEGHGGRIAIQSEPGRGTQFTLTFPSIKRISTESGTLTAEEKESD
jgi:signal transduction histidine kinase